MLRICQNFFLQKEFPVKNAKIYLITALFFSVIGFFLCSQSYKNPALTAIGVVFLAPSIFVFIESWDQLVKRSFL